MNEKEALLTAFLQSLSSSREFRLLNVYKGIPISYPAFVLEASTRAIKIKTERIQIVCLYREKETHLQSDVFPKTLKARVLEMDLPSLTAVLSEFHPIEGRIGIRTQVRVQPNDPILSQIQLVGENFIIHGELADISQNGLAIIVKKDLNSVKLLTVGLITNIWIRIPGIHQTGSTTLDSINPPSTDVLDRFSRENLRLYPLRTSPLGTTPRTSSPPDDHQTSPRLIIQGTIANIIDQPELRRVRIGIHTITNDPSKSVITQFISQRQSEIIREIRTVSEILAKQKP